MDQEERLFAIPYPLDPSLNPCSWIVTIPLLLFLTTNLWQAYDSLLFFPAT